MGQRHTTIAPDLIACIEHGRLPRVDELQRVAAHIRSDLERSACAFSWGAAMPDEWERLLILRVAQAALTGNGDEPT
ncbi:MULTISPECIES: hypothetical protein [Sphingomonas]|jgi:hypothetical protein|uniref:Uncharacterized protein n=1 Tax=Sphingomonas turrisvirgatae TaxID=1888892 RepID=A0A1E3M1I4_9SPHN|nr:hypothetical protein [Sphingomonas turrisvirgatae]ODP38920.1 hypothetical protein BFL28_12735 [Sphingomonas turrisvirgatae]